MAKRSLLKAVAILLALSSVAAAFEDALTPVTFVHLKAQLPAPFKTGELVAEATYDEKEYACRLRYITAKFGSQTVKIPKRILNHFDGVRLETLHFRIGHAITSSTPDGDFKTAPKVIICFRHSRRATDYEFPPEAPLAYISLFKGKVTGVSSLTTGEDGSPKFTDFDPIILKEIIRSVPPPTLPTP